MSILEVSTVDTNLAYLAGLIDGEGCISIRRQNQNYKTRQYTSHAMGLCITNTNEDVMHWLTKHFNGKVRKRHRGNPKHSTIFNWHLSGRAAAVIIQLTLPYLVIKQRQAELALTFAETYNDSWKIKRRVMSPEGRKIREITCNLLQSIQ